MCTKHETPIETSTQDTRRTTTHTQDARRRRVAMARMREIKGTLEMWKVIEGGEGLVRDYGEGKGWG